MVLEVTTRDAGDARKDLYIGELKICSLHFHEPTWFASGVSPGYCNTFEADLDMAIQYCLEQGFYLKRRPDVHYHLVDILTSPI